jgi:FkbM family methyltransferase
MRKIFLDIGMHNGQTILLAMERFPDCDEYIGIEPVKELCDLAQKRIERSSLSEGKRFTIYNLAIDYQAEDLKTVTFYEDVGRNNKLGSSLLSDKTIRKSKKIEVDCVDIRYFFNTRDFREDDYIIMKIDVEGKEYDIFRGMIKHDLLKPIKKMFVEWHWHKVKSIPEQRHLDIVNTLNTYGYELTGESSKDEFYNGRE